MIVGNVYPVTEQLMGASLKSGYQAHYAMTTQQGRLGNTNIGCDEIVINQEAQVRQLLPNQHLPSCASAEC